MRLLAISGSLRKGSYNSALIDAAMTLCPPGTRFEVWRGIAEIPAFNEDVPTPWAVVELRREIAAADALLIATPEYNASVPGALKNVVDWASRPFPANVLRGKPTAVIGASEGVFGAVWAQADLRKVLATAGASVVEQGLSVPQAHHAFTTDGQLRDAASVAALRDTLGALAEKTAERAA